jgi:Family of unknown function (DUF6941)
VRDGLLFVLSGGVSRVLRESFPAALGTCLALVLEFERVEAARPHELAVRVVGEDGEDIAHVEAEVRVDNPERAEPGENVHRPIAVDLRGVALVKPGAYELRVYVDGEHRRTLQLWAELLAPAGTIDL